MLLVKRRGVFRVGMSFSMKSRLLAIGVVLLLSACNASPVSGDSPQSPKTSASVVTPEPAGNPNRPMSVAEIRERVNESTPIKQVYLGVEFQNQPLTRMFDLPPDAPNNLSVMVSGVSPLFLVRNYQIAVFGLNKTKIRFKFPTSTQIVDQILAF